MRQVVESIRKNKFTDVVMKYSEEEKSGPQITQTSDQRLKSLLWGGLS